MRQKMLRPQRFELVITAPPAAGGLPTWCRNQRDTLEKELSCLHIMA